MTPTPLPGPWPHRLRAARAVMGRELSKFLRQPARLASALVRPLLWFLVFAAGFHNVFGVAIIPRLFAGLKQDHDFQLVFLLLMVPCYLYILYFAMRGHRAGRG